MLIDTHCHVHSEFYKADPIESLKESYHLGVEKCILVGVDFEDSYKAVKLANLVKFEKKITRAFVAIGIHPHEALPINNDLLHDEEKWAEFESLISDQSVIAIGECGLDFFYHKAAEALPFQEWLFRRQLDLAKKHNLPVIFHIREAFTDFIRIIKDYPEVKGVIHSFSSNLQDLNSVISLPNDFLFGVNGIATFTKDLAQLEVYQKIPLERIILETDAPFLTPTPNRGKMNTVGQVKLVSEFLRMLRGSKQSIEEFSQITSKNAQRLFNF